EESAERRKPKPACRISSTPSPEISSPLLACFFSSAKITSCLRERAMFSMPICSAISSSSAIGFCLSSVRFIGMTKLICGRDGTSIELVSRAAEGGQISCADMNANMRLRRLAGSCERNGEAECTTGRGQASSPESNWPRRMAGPFDENRLQVGVQEGGQLRLGQGAHLGGLDIRSEEHTSELQSRENLVCRLLLEKKKNNIQSQQIGN